MKKRWPIGLLAVILGLIASSVIFALFAGRQIRGAVPTDAPVLALAAIEPGRLVATTGGVFISRNDLDWAFVAHFGKNPVLMASSNGVAAFRWTEGDQRITTFTSDLRQFDSESDGHPLGSTIAFDEDTALVAVNELKGLLRVGDGPSIIALTPAGLTGVTALAARFEEGWLYAGSLSSGLWEYDLDSQTWQRLVATPTRTILLDQSEPNRIFLGSPGGLLVSMDRGRSWEFTTLREGVEGLARGRDHFYAITSDKLLFRSDDGISNWIAPAIR